MLEPSETALVVIDVQENLIPHIYRHGELIKSIERLIRGCQILNLPILATEQYTKGLGPTVGPLRKALGDIIPMEKMCFSCWDHGPFKEALEATGRRQILLCGIESHVCVYQTAVGLRDSGYEVEVAGDAVSSRFETNLDLALMRFRQEEIPITSVETAVFEMLKVCGTAPFKEWIRVLKGM